MEYMITARASRPRGRKVTGARPSHARLRLCVAVWLMGNAVRAAPDRGFVPEFRGWASTEPSAVVAGPAAGTT
jgi:hypothetical protein